MVREAERALGTFHPITIPAVCSLDGVSALLASLTATNGSMEVVGLNCYLAADNDGGVYSQAAALLRERVSTRTLDRTTAY